MSSNSYPSPISSSPPSPRLNATTPPSDQSILTGTHRTRQTDHPPTASTDIEAIAASVRSRLEQVRSDLLEISSGLPESASQLRTRGEVGPSHDAIMLTGEPEETPENPSPSMSTQELIDAYDYSFRRVVQAQNSLAQMAEQASMLRQSIDHIPAPPIEPPAHGRLLRHQPLPIELQTPRTVDPTLPDDGTTVLGRYVAAREQAAQRRLGRTDTLPADDWQSDPPPPELPSLHQGLSNLELRGAWAVRESQLESIAARRLSDVQSQLASPTSTGPLLWRQEPRRRRLARTDTRPSSTGTRSTGSGTGTGTGTTSTLSSDQSRLSMLSSFYDMQNFSSPASAAPLIPRPLLFEEPESWVESPRGTLGNTDVMVDEMPMGRNYVVRRRITAEGTERVQNVTLPEPSDAELWDTYWPHRELVDPTADVTRRRTMLQTFHERTSRPPSLSSGANPAGPRRRAWARLDADGDDIPLNEEEELERYRTEYRIRRARNTGSGSLFNLNGASPSNSTADSLASRGSSEASASEPVLFPVVTADSPPAPRWPNESISLMLKDNAQARPRRWDPLPMALHAMVPSGKCHHDEEAMPVVVGGWSSFAGR